MGGDTADILGLFREARSMPDATCTVGWGARHTVDENMTRFAKWKPWDKNLNAQLETGEEVAEKTHPTIDGVFSDKFQHE